MTEKYRFNPNVNKIYLDMDGVLADFNKKAIEIFGMHPEQYDKIHGQDGFWKEINKYPTFFYDLELMEDARFLYNAVIHLNPTILTGIPRDMDAFENQKHLWSEKHFGKEQKIICCRASKKSQFCKPGDVIVDDRIRYKKLWEKANGIWITHKSAKESIDKLKEIGVL
jgi:5'(3')-deoxyribonucleotidase